MKKYFFAALFFSIFAFAPQLIAAQAPSPLNSSADFMRRMNTYNSWQMNAMMNARRKHSRSVKRKKVIKRRVNRKKRRTASLDTFKPKTEYILISPKQIIIV